MRVLKMGGLFLALLMMAGCATFKSNYGTVSLDQAVQKQFEAFQLDPDVNYYFSGAEAYPTAIMGLKKAYILDNNLWKRIKPNSEIFTYVVQSMQEKASQYTRQLRGFILKDPQGKAIGVWYSVITIQPMIVKMGEGNKVDVYTPEPFNYRTGGGSSGSTGTMDAR
ncbi:MAG: hypothetical protein PHN75_18065 [Syntrophales bacterium]|nr:hypothetical protein [Syntrophales bacterium]